MAKFMVYIFLLLHSLLSFCQIEKVETINSDSLDFSDLSFLKSSLKDVKIIGLGEQMHYDGATYEAKVRLIKYLHENLGFNVIAFESGLYDCTVANEAISKRVLGDSVNHLNNAIFGIWDCQEVYALADYIEETQQTDNPLILTGFDMQFAGVYARDSLMKDFLDFIDYVEVNRNIELGIDSIQLIKSLQVLAKYSNFYNKIPEEDTLFLSTIITKIEAEVRTEELVKDGYVAYWLRILECIKSDYRKRYDLETVSNLRDSIMAENIKWLANERFKNQKIMLWSANTHLAKNTLSVKNKYLANHKLMGTYLSEYFINSYYFLAFTSYGGRFFNSWLLHLMSKQKPKRKSIERLMNDQGFDYSFINLRDILIMPNSYFQYFNNSKIFGNYRRKMDLLKVADGVFFIKYMHPKTYQVIDGE